jgi:hypothetical protein
VEEALPQRLVVVLVLVLVGQLEVLMRRAPVQELPVPPEPEPAPSAERQRP